MSAARFTSPELFQACATIFGSEIKISPDFLAYLQPIGIKAAYRKRALETHPDRAVILNGLAKDLNAEFINVRQAYERLLSFVESKKGFYRAATGFENSGYQQTDSHYRNRPSRKGSAEHHYKPRPFHKKNTGPADHFYTGNLPKGSLMLGQFLYYSGLISWQTLIEAICWQRRQRPLIGQIATEWGLITYQDVLQILHSRNFDEKFGQCALRIGYISSFELFALVGKQKKLQRPFGEFFIERGLLSAEDIIRTIQKQQIHNVTPFTW